MGLLVAILVNLLASMIAAVAILVTWIVVEAAIYQGLYKPVSERELGFSEGTAILVDSNRRGYISAVSVRTVTDDGVFARAGLRAGDVLPEESITSLFKKLQRHRGRAVELTVVDGGGGPRFHERPKRKIRIDVPPRGLRN
jgi:hypothetical protein